MANDKERLFWITRKNEIIINRKCKARPPKGKQIPKVWVAGKGILPQVPIENVIAEALFEHY